MRRIVVTLSGLTAALFFMPVSISTAYAAPNNPGDTAIAERVVVVPSPPATYTVISGDSISAIATAHGVAELMLVGLNKIPDPDFIVVGQILRLNDTVPIPQVAPAPPPVAPAPVVQASTSVEHTSYTAPAPTRTYSAPAPAASSGSGSSSFEQCVIQRESNGDAQVTNSSGHYGLYQFSYSTWVANGGSPSDFGNASPSEQHSVFIRSAPSNWSPYDSCTP